MVELQQIDSPFEPSLASLASAIDEALASGVSPSEILHMVAASSSTLAEQPQLADSSSDDQECPIYTELPEGLIDLPSASKLHGVNLNTMMNWIRKNQVQVVGRLKAPARGGGYLVVSEDELLNHMASPRNKGGRPYNRKLSA